SHSAVIQADSAKTAQEEIRQRVRALATASEIFVLTPKRIQETFRDVLDRLQRQVEILAGTIPSMPATPDQLAARIETTSKRVEAFVSRCEASAANLENGLVAQVKTLTDRLRVAGEELGREARSAATRQHERDLWVLIVGIVLGTLIAYGSAQVWKAWSEPTKQKVSVSAPSAPW